MCSAEGDYINARMRDGSAVRIKWFDDGQIGGVFRTRFVAEGWEATSEVRAEDVEACGMALRAGVDQGILEAFGVDISTIVMVSRFEAKMEHA